MTELNTAKKKRGMMPHISKGKCALGDEAYRALLRGGGLRD